MLIPNPTQPTLRVAICDPQPIFRIGLEKIFRRHAGVCIAHSCDYVSELLATHTEPDFDILVTDLTSHDPNVIRPLEDLQHRQPNIRVMAFTTEHLLPVILEQTALIIQCFQEKLSSADELLSSLIALGAGNPTVSNNLVTAFFKQRSTPMPGPLQSPLQSLSQRQLQVLKMITHGRTNREIAGHLDIPEPTVKYHVSTIFQRLQVKNRTQAARMWSMTASKRPHYRTQICAVP